MSAVQWIHEWISYICIRGARPADHAPETSLPADRAPETSLPAA